VESTKRRAVAIGAALAVAVAGGGVAYAAATGSDSGDELLRDAAQRLDVSPGELRAALEGAFGDQLDEAVRAGRLTREQADRIEQQVRRFGLPLGAPLDGPRHHIHGRIGHGLDAAADYLGLTRAELARRLMDGRSLAEAARVEGKSVDGLEQALIDEARSRLDGAVADGRLTSEQRDRILSDLEQHVEDLVDGRAPGPFGRFHRHGDHVMGPGGPGMPPPGGFPGHP